MDGANDRLYVLVDVAPDEPDAEPELRLVPREALVILGEPAYDAPVAGELPAPPRDTLPAVAARLETVPQQTFQEARTLGMALAGMPRLNGWRVTDGEVGLYHAVKGAPLLVKLEGYPLLNLLSWLPLPSIPAGLDPEARRERELDNLRAVAGEMRTDGVLMQHVVIGHLLQDYRRLHVTLELSRLAGELGWVARSAQEGIDQRRRLWLWLHIIAAMPVIGRRDGRWQTTGGRVIETDSTSVFWTVAARHDPSRENQETFDPTAPPWAVSIAAGPWLDQWRGNGSVLSYYGDLRTLAAIPNGKPSGAWARSIGLALNQLWREGAAKARVLHVGPDKAMTVRLPKDFTRPQLLDMFPVSPTQPTWQDVLDGPKPQRAFDYWDEALKLLKVSIVGHYAESPARRPVGRGAARWHDQRAEFKTQRLDVRPKAEGMQAIADIAARAKAAQQRRGRAPKKG